MPLHSTHFFFFFFNDTATTEIYTLSLHDALPILILRKPPRSEIVEAAARIDALITERMEAASIVDVMIDTERWLDLHKLFRPLAGTDSRLEDLRMRVITTLFCYEIGRAHV